MSLAENLIVIGGTNQEIDEDVEPLVQKDKPPKKHRHPFGEVHLRIFAWSFMVLSNIGTIMLFFGALYHWTESSPSASLSSSISSLSSSEYKETPLEIFGSLLMLFQYCFMPLTLIANFSIILRERHSFFLVLLRYGGFTFGVFVVYLFFYFRYLVPIIRRVSGYSEAQACALLDSFLAQIFGFLRQMNMFVDLFVCTLIAFFVIYTPKKWFKGKLIYLFRGFVLIPLIWSVVGYVLLALNKGGSIIPGYLFALIPLKPPMFLVVFILLVIYIKVKEVKFRKAKPLENFDDYFFSPESVHKFSRFMAASLGIGSVVDLFFYIVSQVDDSKIMEQVGLGQGTLMFFIIPIILFFDFTKGVKGPYTTMIIMIVGMAAIVLMWIEAVYWVFDFVMKMLTAHSQK